MSSKSIISFKDITELFEAVDAGFSVVFSRIDTWTVDGASVEKNIKIWQLEKVDECEYCYKTFNGWGRGIKHFFFTNDSKTEEPIYEYYDNLRKAFREMTLNVYANREMLAKLVSKKLIEYEKSPLFYSSSTSSEIKDIYDYKFTTFKTRQTKGSNKKGEDAIREVLNAHIANTYPNGVRRDEYTTMDARSRADSVVFNKDSIHVYEIKSAKDSFTRLEKQIEDYRRYADKITIVLDIKKQSAFIKNHARKYKDIEVLFFYGPGIKLERASRGKKLSPTSDKFELLWKNELYEQVVYFISKTSTFSRPLLAALASCMFTKKQAHEIVNEVLYTRYAQSKDKKHKRRGSVDMNAIFHRYDLNSSVLQKKADNFITRMGKNDK